MENGSRHIKRYGTLFFVLCVLVAAWQCFVLVADLTIMGRGVPEWYMVPLSIGNLSALLSPLSGLFISVNDKLGGIGMASAAFVSLSNALLLLCPYWLLRPRWRWLVWIPTTLLTLWCLMQSCYCRAYDDLMPWQSLTLTDNVNSTLMDSTLALLRWHDLLIVVPFLLLIVVCLLGQKNKGVNTKKPLLVTLAAAGIMALMGLKKASFAPKWSPMKT